MKFSRPQLSLLLVFSLLVNPGTAEEFRTWTTITGGHFEAKLNGVGNTAVTLENREGRVIDFSLGDLKPSDQQFARDWQLAKSANGSAPTAVVVERSEFAQRVYKDLVASKGSRLVDFSPEPSDQPRYFAFYRSAMWCPPCRAFTPDLVDFYKKQKRKGAAFELVFISSDKSEELMAEYMAEYDMEWPAFHYGENKDIVKRNGTGIPNLIVTDADGNKLLDSYDERGDYVGPRKVMAELEALLEATL